MSARDARLSALHCGVLVSASGRAFAGYTGRQPAPGRRLLVASRAELPTPPGCEVTSPARRRRIHSASGLSPETPLGEWNDVTIVLLHQPVKDKIHKAIYRHKRTKHLPLIPAQAGIQIFYRWVPAFAGTSGK